MVGERPSDPDERVGRTPPMRILVVLLLLVLAGGAVWVLSYESRVVSVAPCKGGLEGRFVAEKDCEAPPR